MKRSHDNAIRIANKTRYKETPVRTPRNKFSKCQEKLKTFLCPWGRAGFAAAPPHPPPPPPPHHPFPPPSPPPLPVPFPLSPSSVFFSCIPLDLVILLFCRFNLWSFSFSFSLCLCFSSSFQSFCFLVFSSSSSFPSSRLSGGGALSKGVPQRHFGMPAEPLSLAPRPHPQLSFKGATTEKHNPAIPPRKSNKQLTPHQLQTRPKTPPISAPRTTLGPQQSLKEKLPPSCQ